jgi:hypothetical protein
VNGEALNETPSQRISLNLLQPNKSVPQNHPAPRLSISSTISNIITGQRRFEYRRRSIVDAYELDTLQKNEVRFFF